MEDITAGADSIFKKLLEIEKQWDSLFETAHVKLRNTALGLGEDSSTVQRTKKKPKRLSIIPDSDCESEAPSENKENSKNTAAINEHENVIENPNNTAILDKTQAFNDEHNLDDRSKKSKEHSKSSEESRVNETRYDPNNMHAFNETGSIRPSRAAKAKAENNLKEQSLSTKLRRGSEFEKLTKSLIVKVKKEKISDVNSNSDISKSNVTQSSEETEAKSMKRKSDSIEKDDAYKAVENMEESNKKLDDSLQILPSRDTGIISIPSDDDAAEKMPPPQALPRKKRGPKPQTTQPEESLPMRSTRSKVKKEKMSLESSASNQSKSVNKTKSEENIQKEIKKEKEKEIKKEKDTDSDTVSLISSSSNKKGKTKKTFKHKPIKEEKRDSVSGEANLPKPTEKESNQQEKAPKSNKEDNRGSFESIYEDAVEAPKEPEGLEKMKKAVVRIGRVQPPSDENKNLTKVLSPGDATFVSAKDVPLNTINNETFVNAAQQNTFVIDNKENGEKPGNVTKTTNDATFCMNATITKPTDNDKLISSLITEDDSYEEPMPMKKANNLKLKNELFSPFIQSPVKKKVEAFEKKATEIRSPYGQRQTRLKAKGNDAKENKEPSLLNHASKPATPINGTHVNRLFTPIQQGQMISNNSMIKKLPNSTSRVMSITKATTKVAPTSKTPSLTRENSVEDLRRGINKLQQLADEKRKKREQKQQLAQQAREAKEKEREEKLRKMMQEREEKAKKKMLEAEQKKHLEDINRNLKLQEERREAQKRLEKQRQLELEKLEAAKRERDLIENMKILKAKEALQQQRQENIRLAQMKQAKEKAKPTYNFDMLHTDDSTDDEDKPPSLKRPPPPSWSKSAIRKIFMERQAHLPTKIIDNFFSVQPMTPDLREIFPKIDARHLKRNSSMVWRTPPRYSQLPKY